MRIRVRSIFTKIVLWFVATVLLSLVGFVITSAFVSARLSGRNASGFPVSTPCSWKTPDMHLKTEGGQGSRLPTSSG